MLENLTRAEYEFLLRRDFATFAGRCFQDLNPQTCLAMNGHLEIIAAKLNANVEDLDFNPEDFLARVNSDLVGKYVNIASRASNFIHKHFGGALAEVRSGAGRKAVDAILDSFQSRADELAQLYEAREFGKAMREAMALADAANQLMGLASQVAARLGNSGATRYL